MALRVQMFAMYPGVDVRFDEVGDDELDGAVAAHGDGKGRTGSRLDCVGWMSAGDSDEADLVEVIGAVGDDSTCDMRVQGRGLTPTVELAGVRDDVVALAPFRTELQRLWVEAIRRAVGACHGLGRDLAWRTSYDLGGSVGGAEEFPSGVSMP